MKYFKCINNRSREEVLTLNKFYLVPDKDMDDTFLFVSSDIGYIIFVSKNRFIEVTEQVLRKKKINRIIFQNSRQLF
jgi:hypothetical protein